MSTPVCQTTQRGPVLGSIPDPSSSITPRMTSKLSDCAITINSRVWQTRKVSHHVVSPTPWWEFPSSYGTGRESWCQKGVWLVVLRTSPKISKDLVRGRAHEGHWSYVYKIPNGDMFRNWGIVTPLTLVYGYETWHKLSISNVLDLSQRKPSQKDAYGLEREDKQYGRLSLTKILGQTDGIVHQRIGTRQQSNREPKQPDPSWR